MCEGDHSWRLVAVRTAPLGVRSRLPEGPLNTVEVVILGGVREDGAVGSDW